MSDMEEDIIRDSTWWLARRMPGDETLVFLVSVEVSRNEEADDGYVASVARLEPGTITSAGCTERDAAQTALDLFQATVDQCLQDDQLDELIGTSGIMRRVTFPLDTVISALEATISDLEGGGAEPTIPSPWMCGKSSGPHSTAHQ